MIILPRLQPRTSQETSPAPPNPNLRVPEVAPMERLSLAEWMSFHQEPFRQQLVEKRDERPRRAPVSRVYGSMPGLQALLAEEALGDVWEGFRSPRSRVQSLTDNLVASLSFN